MVEALSQDEMLLAFVPLFAALQGLICNADPQGVAQSPLELTYSLSETKVGVVQGREGKKYIKISYFRIVDFSCVLVVDP
ncbi:hypothetical protein ACZ11_02365 [Lysinibacillus xylanilyticus]|uniref:Uncharacterized protein n=1 Tax=Lysinibacillus xylanilyticus TaxID=582475 RepID=A0A0K9FHB5_9BACI|nr:hypothetical protein ACZ11_02365 [Lysinibacillus xylanilyticus]